MKSILIATDLSVRSERALRRATMLAEEHNARLTVLSVVDEDLPARTAKALVGEATQALESLCASISSHPSEILVETGEPVTAIARKADDLDADLLVLGTHRPRPFWDMFSGTTMERTVRATERAVLAVTDAVDHEYTSVLCGIDLSPASASAARMAAEIAPGATFATFYAVHIPYRGLIAQGDGSRAFAPFVNAASRDLDSWWEGANLPAGYAKPEPEVGSVTEVFQAMCARHRPDLLAIGAHGRPMLAPTLLGSFTEGILRDPPCDTLLLRR